MYFPSHKLWSNSVTITISIWPAPVSWNYIPMINYLWEIDFLGSWGSLPQYKSWNNFSSGWPIFKEMPLTNMYCRDLSNLYVTSLDQLNCRELSAWLLQIEWKLKCLVLLLNGVLRHYASWCDQMKWLASAQQSLKRSALDRINQNNLPLLNRVSCIWSSDAINLSGFLSDYMISGEIRRISK